MLFKSVHYCMNTLDGTDIKGKALAVDPLNLQHSITNPPSAILQYSCFSHTECLGGFMSE